MWDELRDWVKQEKGKSQSPATKLKSEREGDAPQEKRITPIHLLIRFADHQQWSEDTIQTHRELLAKHGAVWIGKFGKPLAHHRIETMRLQVQEDLPTFLYLVQKIPSSYDVYRGTIVELSREFPSHESELVPSYYSKRGLIERVGVWTKLTTLEEVPSSELTLLKVATSGSAVPYSLATSMAGMFIVQEGKGHGSL